MSHELAFDNDGKVMHAYVGEVPWTGLGTPVPRDLTPEQMLEAARLNWTVSKRDMFYYDNLKEEYVKADVQALVRDSDGKQLDVVSHAWNPLQNLDAFTFFNEFVLSGKMDMHTAGALKGGKIVWALADIREGFELFGGDEVKGYLLFTNPHTFGRSIDVRFTPVRVVCNNTLTMALNDKSANAVRVNHRAIFDPEEVKETMGLAKDMLSRFKEEAKFLGKRKYKRETLVEYFNRVFPPVDKSILGGVDLSLNPTSRNAEEALAVISTQPGTQFAPGSWWQAFNTVTYMTDHKLGRKTDTRLASAWYGVNQQKKLGALKLAVEYAKAA